jgi:D-alanyl-D-alanine carboxypeptidase/D-alanyl-D-alanine-endopeptidase (penicillin-binding protein 4)
VKNSASSKRKSKHSRGRSGALGAAVFLIACAVAFYWFAMRPQPQTPAGREPVARATIAPPWSAVDRARAVAALHEVFDDVLARSGSHSLVVLDAQGRTLFADCDACAVVPASVQKLVIAATALQMFGPYERLHTLLAARSGRDERGTIDGDLWFVGSGDPSLRSRDVSAGIAALARSGLRSLAGGVVVDASALRGPEINPHWDPDDAGEDFQAPTSAVSIDGDTVEFRVYGTESGEPARVVVYPPSRDVHVIGSAITSDGVDDLVIAAMPERNTYRISGGLPPGSEEKAWLPVSGVERYAGAVLDAALQASGIRTARPASSGRAPLDAIALWDHRSVPMRQLVARMLYVSDNHYAEQLLRIAGGESGNTPDDAGGIAAELAFLSSRGVPLDGVQLYDGSGLAEANRLSALALARILSDAESRGGGYELYPLLPAGGREGTLKHYDFTTAYGRVRAKTGHLSDAASLAGYLDTAHHGRITFAFLINDSQGSPDAAYVRALDRLAEF